MLKCPENNSNSKSTEHHLSCEKNKRMILCCLTNYVARVFILTAC
jgi:hypothetical protein